MALLAASGSFSVLLAAASSTYGVPVTTPSSFAAATSVAITPFSITAETSGIYVDLQLLAATTTIDFIEALPQPTAFSTDDLVGVSQVVTERLAFNVSTEYISEYALCWYPISVDLLSQHSFVSTHESSRETTPECRESCSMALSYLLCLLATALG